MGTVKPSARTAARPISSTLTAATSCPRYVVEADTKLGAFMALKVELRSAKPWTPEIGIVLRLREALEAVPPGLYMIHAMYAGRVALEAVGEDEDGDLVGTGAGYSISEDDLERFEPTGVSLED